MIGPIRIALCGAALAFAALMPGQPARAETAAPYAVTVDYEIKPDQIENYLAALKENAAATIKEPGCRQFDILTVASDPNHVFLLEVYENEAAAEAHRKTDHFKKYAETVKPMVVKRELRPMTAVALHQKEK